MRKVKQSSAEVIYIDEFYRPYLNQYNARRRALECLMEIYVDYFKDGTPTEIRPPSSTTDRMTSQTIAPSEKTSVTGMEREIPTNQKESCTREDTSIETRLKQEVGRIIPTSTSDYEPATMLENNMTSDIPPAPITSRYPSLITTEDSVTMRMPSQGRLSTLSSIARPTPTTATRTVAITREES